MASMYSAKVMEHFANPHNVGELPDANGVGMIHFYNFLASRDYVKMTSPIS